jgi:hypothetical protein
MQLVSIFKGGLASLMDAAEQELGGGKGEDKKKWVMARLGEVLDNAKVGGLAKQLALAFAAILVEVLMKQLKDVLGKL